MAAPIPIGPTLNQIGQIFVNAKDLDRAIAFYRDTLGMTFLFQAPPSMAFFDCDGIRLMLGVPDRPELAHHAVRGQLWEKAVRYLRQTGVKAAARSANHEAVACLEQAVEILDAQPAPAGLDAIDLRLEVFMPLQETFFATRFSMLRDRFGVSWSIINERPRP